MGIKKQLRYANARLQLRVERLSRQAEEYREQRNTAAEALNEERAKVLELERRLLLQRVHDRAVKNPNPDGRCPLDHPHPETPTCLGLD